MACRAVNAVALWWDPWEAYFECTPIRADNALSPLDEAFLVPHKIPYLDDVASDAIVQYLDSLSDPHTSRKQFDHVSRF
jgi:hypothetical protein